MSIRVSLSPLLAGVAFLFPSSAFGQPADTPAPAEPPASEQQQQDAQAAAQTATDEYGDAEEIVVTGARPRGSVIGDIPPERTLDARDIRATGATNISELLEALAPEIGSARGRGGGQPVLLLNGRRISGFRELRDIPTEAILRTEILPEEVALKYGYRADQRVVNIVLRQRFMSTVAEARANAATEGGLAGGTGDLTRLLIQRDARTQLNLHAEHSGMLTEAERDIALEEGQPDDREFRSLVGGRTDIRGSAIFSKPVLGDVSATMNTELEHNSGRSLIGLNEALLEPLERNTKTDSAHAGGTLNWEKSNWHWNVTGNADLARNVTETDIDDPVLPGDRARSTTASGDLTGTANGDLFKLPAGDASATFRAGIATTHLDSERRRAGVVSENDPGRTSGSASVNLDLPISRRNRDLSALGNLTLNANAEVEQLSDLGTLTIIGAGANWSPADRLNFIGSWTREEGAPTISQLGDPVLTTPNARIFDFTTGTTALVTAVTGGNPDLLADKRNVFKIGGNWQPDQNLDLRLRADYVHQTIDRPVATISATPEIEAAFPDRFLRNGAGELVAVDLRPVNFDQSRRNTLRLGFDFSKPLKSQRPSQSTLDQLRAQWRGQRGGGQAGGPPPGPPPDGGPPRGEGGSRRGFGGGGRGFGGGGGFFGGGPNRGRLTFSLTDTITFVDKVRIASGGPELDYLDGAAAGSNGGTPRHQVEAQAGYFNNGLGARLSANWRSGTNVDSLDGNDLRFSPYGTFNLRLFANLGERLDLVAKQPWLRGTSLRFEVNNIFNARPTVHDASGNVPLNYQPDLLDPLGRTVMVSFRKLFLPSPATFRRMREQQRQREQGSATP